jgi:CPA1 family monovalent cation:H+ antiporter
LVRLGDVSVGLAIAAALIVLRVLWVFPLSAVIARRGERRSSWPAAAVVSWAGARGVVPLAAALSVPLLRADGTPLPQRELVLLLTTAVIVTSLVVQGLTLAPLVPRTGISVDLRDVHREHTAVRARLARAALAHLDQIDNSETAAQFAIEQLRHSWTQRLHRIQPADGHDCSGPSPSALYRRLRHDLLEVESAELDRLHRRGEITERTRRRIQRVLDLEQAGLHDSDT